ncbi:hypothetical protein V8E51_007280 [Hyaloscypha variabilis]
MRRRDLPSQNVLDFGQTTALMLWLPAAWEILILICKSQDLSSSESTNEYRETGYAPAATSEAVVDKGVAAPVEDEQQLDLDSNDSGKLTVRTSDTVE